MLDFLIDNAWGLLIGFVIIGVLVAPRNLRGSFTSTQNADDSMTTNLFYGILRNNDQLLSKTRRFCYGIIRYAKRPTSRYNTFFYQAKPHICCTEKGVFGTEGYRFESYRVCLLKNT